MKHKTIIFDLAGVVMNLNIERDTEALKSVGFPDFAGCVANDDIRVPMLTYLNGLCTKAEFCRDIRPFCRPDATDDEILWSMDAVLDDIPLSRLQTIAELKKTHNVYLLSNIYDTAWQHAVKEMNRNGYGPEDCFDKLFLSYEMQMAKPDVRIFAALLEETGAIPADTIYFDDTAENIDTAKRLGIKAVLVPMNRLEDVLETALGRTQL